MGFPLRESGCPLRCILWVSVTHGADPMHFEKIINRNYIINSLEYFPNDWGVDGAL